MYRLLLLILVLAAGIQSTAYAAIFCVSNGTELAAALTTAGSNGQDDEIRLKTGVYTYPNAGGGTFVYTSLPTENYDIELSGGWTRLLINSCGQQPSSSRAIDTAITGNNSHQLMTINASHAGMNVTISRITFSNGNGGNSTGGLNFPAFSDNTGTILIDQCAFIGNAGGYASALRVNTATGTIRLRNSLFKDNVTSDNTTVGISGGSAGNAKIYISNNTMIENTSSNPDISFTGMYVFGPALAQAYIVNNNLWGNEGTELAIGGDIYSYVFNNNIENYSGTPDQEGNNISVVPVYQSGQLNYTPANGSPLIDAGLRPPTFIPIPPSFRDNWRSGDLDVFSRARKQGVTIDIGAYESSLDTSMPEIFADSFE